MYDFESKFRSCSKNCIGCVAKFTDKEIDQKPGKRPNHRSGSDQCHGAGTDQCHGAGLSK